MNILVVDDEKDVQPLFEQRFRKEIRAGDMQFAFANSGEEALSYLNQHLHEAVLILSDINMPGMTGLELYKELKKDPKMTAPPWIMLTSSSEGEKVKEAIQAGITSYIIKPYKPDNLLKQVVTKLSA